MAPRTRYFLSALLLVLGLDQLTKQLVIRRFYYGEQLPVIDGWLTLTHVRNPGGAFSFLADGPSEWRLAFFIATTLVAIGLLVVYFIRLEPGARLTAAALGAILGGALGNLIDRIVHGEVIDFIDVHLSSGYTWPTFNIADSGIVVGVSILLALAFFEEPHAEPDAAPPGDGEPDVSRAGAAPRASTEG